ncbi:MAG: cupredoxin domain-containing protein [Actinomycetota bacterium]
MNKLFLLAFLAVVALIAAACGGSDGVEHSPAASDDHMDSHDPDHMEGTVPGGPADEAEASTEVEVEAHDDFTFTPASIEVEAGEVVTFVVRNEGLAQHEFVLGDEAYQQMHEAEMQGDHDMDMMENAVVVPGGETKKITWRFDEAGEVLFGCHEPGHYKAGMVGRITIDA